MGTSEDLLRMLEPAVRPGNVPGAIGRGRLPIEQESFESLLAAQVEEEGKGQVLKGGDGSEGKVEAKAGGGVVGIVRGLAGVDRVENASLLKLMGEVGMKSLGKNEYVEGDGLIS